MNKKLSEMTPWERVEPRLKGLSNEEAEDVAIKILAQIAAKHYYVFNDFEEWAKRVFRDKLWDAILDYKDKHAFELSLGSVMKNYNR